MSIKILGAGLPVVGRAQIGDSTTRKQGGKDRPGPPVKFDHIELRSTEKDAEGNFAFDLPTTLAVLEAGAKTCGGCTRAKQLAKKFGEAKLEGGLPVELEIGLPYDDLELNFPHRLAYFRGRTAFCVGDGESAGRLDVLKEDDQGRPVQYGERVPWTPCGSECPDFQGDPPRCKPSGRLRFVLGVQENVGGVFQWSTSSWNSIRNMVASLELVRAVTGGRLAWLPLRFTVAPQVVQPKRGGAAQKVMVARVIFAGSPQQLRAQARAQLEELGELVYAQRQLEVGQQPDWYDDADEVETYRAEFDHENVEAEAGEEEGSEPESREGIPPDQEGRGNGTPGTAISPDKTNAPGSEGSAPPQFCGAEDPSGSGATCAGPPDHEGNCIFGDPFSPEDESGSDSNTTPAEGKGVAEGGGERAEGGTNLPSDSGSSPTSAPPPEVQCIGKNEQGALWQACQQRAQVFEVSDPKAVATKILRTVCEARGFRRSDEIPLDQFDSVLADVRNARKPA